MRTPVYNDESDVKRDIKKLLKKYGIWYFMPSASEFGKSGIPDFICCVHGTLLAIEAKFGYNKPTEMQRDRINEINAAGGIAIWVNENRLHLLERLLQKLCSPTTNT